MKIHEFIDAEIKRIEEAEGYPPGELGRISVEVTKRYETQCVHDYIGGFDSTGYDIECYAFAYIENGSLKIHGYNYESY